MYLHFNHLFCTTYLLSFYRKHPQIPLPEKVANLLHHKGFHWVVWGKLVVTVLKFLSLCYETLIDFPVCDIQKWQHIQRFQGGVQAFPSTSWYMRDFACDGQSILCNALLLEYAFFTQFLLQLNACYIYLNYGRYLFTFKS